MFSKSKTVYLQVVAVLVFGIACFSPILAQQTLGGIDGTVTDASGGTVPDASVTVVQDSTQLTRTAKSNAEGSYAFVNLPIGTYTVTVTHDGFDSQKFPNIAVQADRTATLNANLKVGSVNTSVEVDATPLMNATDTTNGYVLDKAQIEAVPLANGSPLALATLSAGVNAELSGGTGVNSGLGNPPIWANGQRDTSNTLLVNGVDASNLFNGKSTSQVASARIINSTGNGNNGAGGVIQSSSSIYLSIGNAIPSPAPETLSEVRVNTSMYDAQQGSTNGAHIDMSTASGTNQYHGSAYIHRGTNWINAAPFFYNQDPSIPNNDKVPQLHRYTAGGTFGGPIIKDKLFAYLAYQHLHDSDQEIGSSRFSVPTLLADTGQYGRSTQGIANVANDEFLGPSGQTPMKAGDVNSVAYYLLNAPALPGEQAATGSAYLIPSANGTTPSYATSDNAFIPGTAYLIADQAIANVDWNASQKDTLALKYYYQHNPTTAPYAFSNIPGFTQHLDAGSQVASINNTYLIKPNLSTQETFGFIREKLWSDNTQIISPQQAGINEFGSTYFPGVSIVDTLGSSNPSGNSPPSLNLGGNANAQSSLTGMFQNRWMPSGNAVWSLGKHTVQFGGSYAYTQLNVRDKRTGSGTVSTPSFGTFAQGIVTPDYSFFTTTFLQGDADRYYRSNQVGMYVQDKYQIRSNLSLTAGLRYDWNGGLSEKYGRLYNFAPELYVGPDTADSAPVNNGFLIAGNNVEATPGVSKTTLTGRQWGIAPRLGFAFEPEMFNSKVVVRGGTGMYFDRGELFSYFSPGYAIGTVTGGPFGVNQAPPFVSSQVCPGSGYPSTCDPAVANLNNPWGTTLGPPPTGKASDINQYLPSINSLATNPNVQPFSEGIYDRKNKLPYSINYTLDIQWQPRNDVAIDIGYVGTVSRHQIIPVPFNQPRVASPSSPSVPLPGSPQYNQNYTYGYTIVDTTNCQPPDYICYDPQALPDGTNYLQSPEGGNVDLRVPYLGYASESIDYKAAGIAAYNALQVHVEKRLSHGLQFGFSYTYSHATDEQSAMGLFYNGNNPLNLQEAYGSSDFDRTHAINFSFVYNIPTPFSTSTIEGKLANGWSLQNLTVIQSGQPYSIIDYTGSVGSIFYSTYNGITNPIVPLGNGCTAKTAKTGASGAFTNGGGMPALKANCFTIPLLHPGDLNGAIPDGSNGSVPDLYETNFTTGQRNIFRQPYQKRADMSLVKNTQITERFSLRYTFDVFNITNTTSFDIPKDNVSQNQYYNQFPTTEGGLLPALPTGCDIHGNQTNTSFYNCPGGLGITTHAIGAPRQIQMSLRLTF